MTVVVQTRDRCRLCFSLLLRDRSICCQKSYHLFKHIEREKIPINKLNPYQIKIRNQTVCFRDLILRYLHTQIDQTRKFSNLICYDCSMVLLDIEQCAKYLRKTINQLKIKLNKSNRLRTSSLSATFQKKRSQQQQQQQNTTVKDEPIPIIHSDSDEEFDDIDDEEEFDDEQDDTSKPNVSTNIKSSNQLKSLQFTSPSSGGDSSSSLLTSKVHLTNTTNRPCNDNDHDGEDEDEEDEDGLIKSSHEKSQQQQNLTEFFHRLQTNSMNALSGSNGLITTGNTMNLLQETDPNLLQLRLAHMMQSAANSTNMGQNLNHSNNNNMDPMMNTIANMQRNFLLQCFNDPIAAAQVAQAAAAAVSATQIKSNITPMSLITPNAKQIGGGRKRKSTPGKRVITNHRSSNNNDDISPTIEHESTDPNNMNDSIDHPLELTLKCLQQSNRVLPSSTKSTADVHNLVINAKMENGSPSYQQNYLNQYQSADEDRRESATPNDSSLSLSPSLSRRTAHSKRQKMSTIPGQYDYTNNLKINLSQTPTLDLLSPNHQTTLNDDMNTTNQQKQQSKLDPRSCAECGKILFSDKAHLIHCQTHAKNEKQCWICGIHDDDIKKHIINVHGNQKFTNTGFKVCQHCEKVFPVYADLEAHTREHSKKKPFECPICNKRFGQQGNLSCHLRIHSGVKPFTCANCGKAFRHSNSLRRHARTVHSATRGLSMSPGSVATATPNSLLLTTATTSNSMVSMTNDVHRLSTSETFDDGTSGLMIPSDDAESLQGPPSTSTAGVPSPSISNAQIDSDSHEQFGTS
ncbi:unnamed protein product [Adineta steineri]|uniref:C2H2-type domain-containing protein n=1 Tax=Adineta steineri TaxID=433720 RepID=A0A815L9X5_9BILA|nr:unnamed protein product [Adineta steineri]